MPATAQCQHNREEATAEDEQEATVEDIEVTEVTEDEERTWEDPSKCCQMISSYSRQPIKIIQDLQVE